MYWGWANADVGQACWCKNKQTSPMCRAVWGKWHATSKRNTYGCHFTIHSALYTTVTFPSLRGHRSFSEKNECTLRNNISTSIRAFLLQLKNEKQWKEGKSGMESWSKSSPEILLFLSPHYRDKRQSKSRWGRGFPLVQFSYTKLFIPLIHLGNIQNYYSMSSPQLTSVRDIKKQICHSAEMGDL